MPEKERPAAEAGLDPYKEELERTIVDYEEVEVTPEKAAAILRADKYVKPEQVTYFMERADASGRQAFLIPPRSPSGPILQWLIVAMGDAWFQKRLWRINSDMKFIELSVVG